MPDIPLPRGARWDYVIDQDVAIGRREPGLMQEVGFRAQFEGFARCAWLAD